MTAPNMNTAEKINVMQAHAEGRTIQCRRHYRNLAFSSVRSVPGSSYDWVDTRRNLDFNFGVYDYRVKPEPREFKVWLTKSNPYSGLNFEESTGRGISPDEVITVREVL